jgi:hypothetical protein
MRRSRTSPSSGTLASPAASRRRGVILCVVVVLGVAACGRTRSDPPVTPAPPGSSGATATGPSAHDSLGQAAGTGFVSWIKNFGPLGGGGGTHEAAYTNLSRGDCAAAMDLADASGNEDVEALPAPLKHLYRGAGAACLAAFHDRSGLWRWAEGDLAESEARTGGFTCGDRQVLRMLRELIRLHRAGHTRFAKGSGTSACARVRHVQPNSGSAAGGYAVTLVGENFPPATFPVLWCTLVVSAAPASRRAAHVTVPPRANLGDDCDSVHVDVGDDIGVPVRPTARFTYDERTPVDRSREPVPDETGDGSAGPP